MIARAALSFCDDRGYVLATRLYTLPPGNAHHDDDRRAVRMHLADLGNWPEGATGCIGFFGRRWAPYWYGLPTRREAPTGLSETPRVYGGDERTDPMGRPPL
jgi:hypothetical protein